MSLELSLRSVGLFAASQVKTNLSRITNLSRSIKAVQMAPQNNPGASGQMAMKLHCSLTARRFNELPSASRCLVFCQSWQMAEKF
jgi:hypothetical protein